MSAIISKIGDSELEIMKVLWRESPMTANEIHNKLSPKKSWSKSTVITLANRLVEKGALRSEKRGLIIYVPVISEQDYTQYQAKSFVNKIFGGSTKNLLAYFCESEDITQQDLDELKLMVKNREV